MSTRGAILDHLIDLKNGIIPLIGDVDEHMYVQVVRSLMALQSQNKDVPKLTFVLNTYGGDLYQALAIYDLIKMQPMPTVVQCNGPVMSAGTVILQAGDVRLMTKRSYLMYHFGTQQADSSQCLSHFNSVVKDIKEIYKLRSKLSSKVINGWFEKDTYYNAQDAIKNRLIDGIVEYEQDKENER